jgi:hypothetical protein
MRRPLLVLLTAVLVGLTACSSTTPVGDPTQSGTAAPTPYPTPVGGLGNRPSSPVKITLLSPTNGEVVHGTSVLVRVSITGGIVTPTTSSIISPTKGHVHLYLNNQLFFMAYTLSESITVKPGLEYAMYAEYVAQDHFPFSPRDVTPPIYFTVAPA